MPPSHPTGSGREHSAADLETTAPAAAIGLLLDDEPTPDVAKGIEDAIASKEFPVRNDHGRSTLYLAFERYPKPVAAGLLRRT